MYITLITRQECKEHETHCIFRDLSRLKPAKTTIELAFHESLDKTKNCLWLGATCLQILVRINKDMS